MLDKLKKGRIVARAGNRVDASRLIQAIKSRYYGYVKEDELNPYEQLITKPLFNYTILGLIVIVWGLMEIMGGSENPEVLVQLGANYGPLILAGEFWRLFTSMFLHIGLQHLAFNFVALVAFGFEMERLYGHERFLIIYILSGLFGSLASFALNGPSQFSAGASGAIFGVVGMNLAFFVYYRHRFGEYGRWRIHLVLILIGLNLILGYTLIPVDNMAHIGGLVTGILLGYLLAPRYRVVKSNLSPRVVDHASLLKRWWVVVLTVAILSGGLWLSLVFWSEGYLLIPFPDFIFAFISFQGSYNR